MEPVLRSTALSLSCALWVVGCGDPVREPGGAADSDTRDTSSETAAETSTDSGSDGATDSDAAETTPIGPGTTQIANVPGGVKASSSKYILLTTTGQTPGANGRLNSTKYTLTGGIVSLSKP